MISLLKFGSKSKNTNRCINIFKFKVFFSGINEILTKLRNEKLNQSKNIPFLQDQYKLKNELNTLLNEFHLINDMNDIFLIFSYLKDNSIHPKYNIWEKICERIKNEIINNNFNFDYCLKMKEILEYYSINNPSLNEIGKKYLFNELISCLNKSKIEIENINDYGHFLFILLIFELGRQNLLFIPNVKIENLELLNLMMLNYDFFEKNERFIKDDTFIEILHLYFMTSLKINNEKKFQIFLKNYEKKIFQNLNELNEQNITLLCIMYQTLENNNLKFWVNIEEVIDCRINEFSLNNLLKISTCMMDINIGSIEFYKKIQGLIIKDLFTLNSNHISVFIKYYVKNGKMIESNLEIINEKIILLFDKLEINDLCMIMHALCIRNNFNPKLWEKIEYSLIANKNNLSDESKLLIPYSLRLVKIKSILFDLLQNDIDVILKKGEKNNSYIIGILFAYLNKLYITPFYKTLLEIIEEKINNLNSKFFVLFLRNIMPIDHENILKFYYEKIIKLIEENPNILSENDAIDLKYIFKSKYS